MNKKSLCGSCANNCVDHAYDVLMELAEDGVYIQSVGNVNACVCKVKKSMTYDDEVLVRCSAYVRREDENHDND